MKDEDSFDLELEEFNSGKLPASHIFNLGKPGEILQNCGFPAAHRIELAAARLRMKATQGNHPFDIMDIQGLAEALQKPVAVFEYGDKSKSQNVIVNLEKDGKNFLVGVFFNQKQRGYEVSDIRGLFNRDNMDWIHWIQQGKMIYGNKEKIQVLAEQQRTNLAEVHNKEARTSSDSYYLDSVDNILQSFGDVKDIYTKDYPGYAEQKERFEIFKKFRSASQKIEAINFLDVVQKADEFYDALKSNNKEVIARYTDAVENPELADAAKSIIEEQSFRQKEKSQEIQCAELLMAQGLDSLDSDKILHQTNSLVNKTTSTLVIDSNQAARIKAAREIKENMPNLSEKERAAAIAILEAGAKSQGMEFSEYVENTFPDGIFGDIKKAENAAKQQGVKINGAVSVNGFGENVKAVIYAGKTADFSTWCHELSHIWQAQLTGELKQNAEEAFQVKDSDWQNSIYTFQDGHTDTSAEAFAYGFEDFLKNKAGEMATEDKKEIFEKFADYMSRTYNGVKQHIEINEKIASVYQKLVELDDNILAQAEKAVQMEKNAKLGIPEAERQREVVKKLYQDTDKWLKAPNGNPTKLTEEQWIAVRTPNFKRWFGNWEFNENKIVKTVELNDSEVEFNHNNASEVEKWLKENLSGKSIIIDSSGAKVLIFNKGLKDSLKRHGEVQRNSYAVLEDLISKSELFDFIKSDGKSKHNGLLGQDVYYSALKVGENYYSVQFKFDVSEKYRTDSYKDHKIMEIKTAPLLYHGSKDVHAITSAVHNFTISQLTNGVKPNFSKMIDENGEPLVVYHGSPNKGFDVFDKNKIGSTTDYGIYGKGFYFSNKKNQAEIYGDTVNVFLNIRKPLILTDYHSPDQIADELDAYPEYFSIQNERVKPTGSFAKQGFVSYLEAKDYDGVIVKQTESTNEIVSFYANQIKSSIDNNGNFDINNDSILFQTAYHGSGANFDKFNTSEYGMSGEGAMVFGYGVYVSNSESIAKSYAGRQGERNLYTVEIPDGNYISWDKPVSKSQKENVKNELYKKLIEEDYKGAEKEIFTELNTAFGDGLDGKYLYGTVSSYIGSDKETSKFFKDIGFSGIEYPAGTVSGNGQNAVNYVIFNDEDIKIKEHFQFQIIGENGALKLDQSEKNNFRIENLKIAQEMAAKGKDEKSIRFATGWEKGVDNKWRYEIDDSKYSFDLINKTKNFERNNPRYVELVKKSLNQYNGGEDLSDQEWDELDKFSDIVWNEYYEAKQVWLTDVLDAPELYEAYPQLKDATVVFDNNPYSPELGSYTKIKYLDSNKTGALIKLNKQPGETDVERYNATMLHEIQHIIQDIEGFAYGGNLEQFVEYDKETAFEKYSSLAGEVESRNVEKRMNMTQEERKNILLSATEDIPRNNQIIQFPKQKEDIIMENAENFESQEYWKEQFHQENADTFKAIDDYLDKGIRPKGEIFSFPKVPKILKFSGISENTIQFSTKVINKAKNTHNLTNEEIKSALINIASPVLIFDSDTNSSENKENSVLFIANSMASSNKPLAITLNMNVNAEIGRKEIIINEIRSIHDRTLIAKNGTDLIQKWTENGLCRYVDDKKISEWQLAAGVQFPLAVLHSDKNNILSESDFVNDKKISERQLATGEQFPLAVLHSDENNINLSPEIVNSTDYQEIRTFSKFAEQQKAMEKEYQEYLGTISPDEESSRRIDSGEIFGKFENQQAKEELSVATYKFQSGETLDEIIQGNSDFPTETALLDNLIDVNIREVYEYATEEEQKVLRQFASFRNDYDTDMKNLAVQTDCASRWIAAKHWNPEKQEFQKDYVNHAAVAEFPYKLPWEMKEIESQVLQTENEIIDNGIESIQVNSGMSEAAIETEMLAQGNNQPEVEEYNDGQIPLQVVAQSDFNYFNSDKISFTEYIVRTDASVAQDLIEKNADSFNNTNTKLEENAIPCIIVRKSVNPEIPDQFLLSKYENNNLNKEEIAEQAGNFASKEIKIEDTELITQIKNAIEWNDRQNKTQVDIPELKIYHTLKEEKTKNLEIITQEEFDRIVDALYQDGKPDYKNIPEIIRLPKVNDELAAKLNIDNENFFLKTNIAHARPQRKGGYAQSLRKEEMKGMLDFISSCQTAYVDTDEQHQNFFLAGLDEKDNKKANKIVFNKDELGNYIVTIGKVDIVNLQEKNYTKVAVGVEPTIWSVHEERSPATMLRPSTTLATEETISQAAEKSINEQKIKMPDQLVYAAAKVGQVIEQRTLEAQSIVNPTRADRLSTISVSLNKEYNEDFALSTVKKLLETEKNTQNENETELQQIEPGLQKKFDKLKAVIKSREEQEPQGISPTEELENKRQAKKSKSDIIRQAGKDFLESVKKGIAPFFNAEDDFQRIIMHPQSIINASNGLPFSGESQLLAQIYHKQHEMEGEIVTSIGGAKSAGTIVLDTPESRQKNFALTDTSSLAEKNSITRTRYFMPESCEEPDKVYAHTLQQQRPEKIRSYRDLIRHFENIPNGQKEIADIRIRIAHEHLKEIQSRLAIKEERTLSVEEIEERKNFLRNYFERLPADYRASERSAFEDTFGIQLNPEKDLEINLQRKFKDIDFDELKKNTKKSIDLENKKLSSFIEKNTMQTKKLASIFKDEYKSQIKEEKQTAKNLKIEATGIKEPEVFLGKYLAACNSNAEFVTDKDTVEQVKKNLEKKLEENFKLEKYDILKEIGQQAQSISNETTKQISFEKAHSNKKNLGKAVDISAEISPLGMGK